MRKVSTLVGLALLSLTSPTLAQDSSAHDAAPTTTPASEPSPTPVEDAIAAAPAEKLILGLDAAAQIPVSSAFRDQNAIGLGGLLRVELNLIQNLNLTLRGGYVYGLKHSVSDSFRNLDYKVSTLPVWIGGKYFITDMIYGALEVGYDRLSWSYDGTLVGVASHDSKSENKFGGSVGAGVVVGPVDVKAQLEILDFGHTGDTMAVMINIGYDFLKLLGHSASPRS